METVRSKEEIEKVIKDLQTMRKNMPHHSMFGDDNHAALDAQIAILKGEKKYSDFENADDYVNGEAYSAEYWLTNKKSDPLYDADDIWFKEK